MWTTLWKKPTVHVSRAHRGKLDGRRVLISARAIPTPGLKAWVRARSVPSVPHGRQPAPCSLRRRRDADEPSAAGRGGLTVAAAP